jgi:hypothetical protein
MNENHKNHKLTWLELHRTGGDDKETAIIHLGLPVAAFCCYACESVQFFGVNYGECRRCPVQWGDTENCYSCCEKDIKSPFRKWLKAKTPRTRKKYALIIANMEWRTKK